MVRARLTATVEGVLRSRWNTDTIPTGQGLMPVIQRLEVVGDVARARRQMARDHKAKGLKNPTIDPIASAAKRLLKLLSGQAACIDDSENAYREAQKSHLAAIRAAEQSIGWLLTYYLPNQSPNPAKFVGEALLSAWAAIGVEASKDTRAGGTYCEAVRELLEAVGAVYSANTISDQLRGRHTRLRSGARRDGRETSKGAPQ